MKSSIEAINNNLDLIMKKIQKLEHEKNIDEEINSILDCFDFYKVKQVMEFLEWTWCNTDGVPEIWDLRKKARYCLQNVAEQVIFRPEKEYFTATGGFYASAKVYDDDPKIYLDLKFVVSDWDNFD